MHLINWYVHIMLQHCNMYMFIVFINIKLDIIKCRGGKLLLTCTKKCVSIAFTYGSTVCHQHQVQIQGDIHI